MPNFLNQRHTALILVDLIDIHLNKKSRYLRKTTQQSAVHIASLKAHANKSRTPVIFANDHFGNWHSKFEELVDQCIAKGGESKHLAETLNPLPQDYSILKPRHSAFYGTPLTFLLEELKVRRLILAGIEADVCVMFTANDAYIRKYELNVPRNCVAASTPSKLKRAMQFMKENLNADITPLKMPI